MLTEQHNNNSHRKRRYLVQKYHKDYHAESTRWSYGHPWQWMSVSPKEKLQGDVTAKR